MIWNIIAYSYISISCLIGIATIIATYLCICTNILDRAMQRRPELRIMKNDFMVAYHNSSILRKTIVLPIGLALGFLIMAIAWPYILFIK